MFLKGRKNREDGEIKLFCQLGKNIFLVSKKKIKAYDYVIKAFNYVIRTYDYVIKGYDLILSA